MTLAVPAVAAEGQSQSEVAPQSTAPSDTSSVSPVTVAARLEPVKILADRKVYDLSKSPLYDTQSISEALADIPNLSVAPNGSVTAWGRTPVTIFVDGRAAPQFQGEAGLALLSQLQANRYSRVEFITNPPASFSASITGPIVNLITKPIKASTAGTSLKVAVISDGGGDFSINNDRAGETWTTSTSLSARNAHVDRTSRAQLLIGDDPASRISTERDSRSTGWNDSRSLSFEVRKKSSARLSFTANAQYSLVTQTRRNEGGYLIGDDLSQSYREEGTSKNRYEATQASFDATFKKSVDDTLSLHLDAVRLDGKDRSAELLKFSDVAQSSADYSIFRNSVLDLATIKTTAQHRFSERHSLDMGVEYEIQNEHRLDGLQGDTGDEFAPYLTDFSYRQRLLSVFATNTYTRGRLSVVAGARYEDYDVASKYADIAGKQRRAQNALYPSINASYQLAKRQDISASYTEKVIRPAAADLNDAIRYDAPGYVSRGNAALKPSTVQTLEVSYDLRKGDGQYGLTARYETFLDDINAVQTADDNGLVTSTKANTGDTRVATVSAYARYPVSRAITLGADGSFARNRYTSSSRWFSDYSGDYAYAKVSLDWKLNANQFAQLRLNYWGSGADAQRKSSPYFTLNLGYRNKLTARVTLIVTVNDVLGTSNYRSLVRGQSINSVTSIDNNNRRVSISLVRRFGVTEDKKDERFDYRTDK